MNLIQSMLQSSVVSSEVDSYDGREPWMEYPKINLLVEKYSQYWGKQWDSLHAHVYLYNIIVYNVMSYVFGMLIRYWSLLL